MEIKGDSKDFMYGDERMSDQRQKRLLVEKCVCNSKNIMQKKSDRGIPMCACCQISHFKTSAYNSTSRNVQNAVC